MLTIENFNVIIDDAQLKIVQSCEPSLRTTAEGMAVAQMKSYLASRFDTDAIFSATGSERNQAIVMYLADITLYHLFAKLPQRMGMEIRQLRYEAAIRWLEQVAAGKITPALPTLDASEDAPGSIIYGSDSPNSYNW
jgi:phage gp36-like protein